MEIEIPKKLQLIVNFNWIVSVLLFLFGGYFIYFSIEEILQFGLSGAKWMVSAVLLLALGGWLIKIIFGLQRGKKLARLIEVILLVAVIPGVIVFVGLPFSWFILLYGIVAGIVFIVGLMAGIYLYFDDEMKRFF